MQTIPTPTGAVDIDPNRWTAEEVELIGGGLCPWQTGYGLPWTTYCKAPGMPFCPEHDAEERAALNGAAPAWLPAATG